MLSVVNSHGPGLTELSVDKLHCCLGHVSHERAKLLAKKGLVEGVELSPDVEATVCES